MSDAGRILWDEGDTEIRPLELADLAPDMLPLGESDPIRRPTGTELFAAMTKAQQDDALGPEAAELVRTGVVDLREMKKRQPMRTEDDWITQRPVQDVRRDGN